ncbi:grpE protein homolog 2, mitochondrial-like [Syzygium oleosum]|uniref:grpE protein homolog 2, mitochondrial-like n=1 Tax=Syzygium oleosum TaxID=219896 RepID=UPI0011D1A72C|nr:grpE protein homolog 2, mitochondrial-like [Syzygium oleosum]
MLVSRVFSRAWRGACRSALLLPPSLNKPSPVLSNQFDALSPDTPCKALVLNHSTFSSSLLRRFGISSSASPEPSEKDQGSTGEKNGASTDAPKAVETKVPNQAGNSGSEGDEELSMDDLVKLVSEKEELLKMKHKQIDEMQDKVLRTYAEMENVMDRTRREAENAKKYAIQSFAKSLLDVADNLGRASSVVMESFAKIDASKDTTGAVPLLKTLLEGVEMTQKQLLEVFKKSGIEKYDPVNEPFDPHRHNAVFQLQDDSKPPGTVAVVLKPGYMLYERVLRPAEVGVTQAAENDTQG